MIMSTDGSNGSRARNMNWLSENKNKVKKSRKHENRIATELGGVRTARSGGSAWSKYDQGAGGSTSKTAGRDITTPDLYVEHKFTEKQSMSLKLDWLEKVHRTAASGFKDPAVVITFDTEMIGKSYRTCDQDWVLVPLKVFQKLKNLTKEDLDDSSEE